MILPLLKEKAEVFCLSIYFNAETGLVSDNYDQQSEQIK